ncbi:MAG: OmpA family protein [Methylophilaceae bacterium]
MKKNILSIAVAASLGFVACAASAEEAFQGAWYAVPGVSYMTPDNDLKANDGGGAFIKLGKELSPSWDIQGGVGYNQASQDTGITGASGHYKQTTVSLDALYMLGREKFRPFILAGLGVAHNNVDYSGIGIQEKSHTSWLAGAGVGAQYLFTDSFGIQADVRQQWSRSSARATGLDADGVVGNTLFSLGGIFRFAAPAPMPVVAAAQEPVAAPAPAPAPVVAAAPEPSPVVEACKPNFETITISAEKLFGFDKYKLQDEAKPVLDEVAAKLIAHPEFELVIVAGHTDRIGSEAYNLKLSERRANAVKAYIVTKGIDSSRLQAVGKGKSEPVVECKGVKGKAAIECLQPNRRVVIYAQEQHKSGCD